MPDHSTLSSARAARLLVEMVSLKMARNAMMDLATITSFPMLVEAAAKGHSVATVSSITRKSVTVELTTRTLPILAGSTARNRSVVMVLLMLERLATTETESMATGALQPAKENAETEDSTLERLATTDQTTATPSHLAAETTANCQLAVMALSITERNAMMVLL